MCRRAQWGGPAQPKASNNITCDLLNMLFIQRRTAMDEDDRATWLLRNSQGSNANCWWCSSVLPNTHLSHTSIFGCTYVHHPLFPTPKTAVSSWHCIQWQRSHYLQHKVNLCSTAHRKMQRCSDAVRLYSGGMPSGIGFKGQQIYTLPKGRLQESMYWSSRTWGKSPAAECVNPRHNKWEASIFNPRQQLYSQKTMLRCRRGRRAARTAVQSGNHFVTS